MEKWDDQLTQRTLHQGDTVSPRPPVRELQYRELINNLPLGVCRVTVDGKLVEINLAAQALFGFSSREEAATRHVCTLYADPSDWDRLVGRLVEQGQVTNWRVRMRRTDGHIFWTELHAGLVCDEKGQSRFIDCFIEDITKRKRTAEGFADACLARLYDVTTRYQGQKLFEQAVEALAELLSMEHVLIGALEEDGHSLRVLVLYNKGIIEHGFQYELRGTPGERVIRERRLCAYLRRVREFFPQDPLLRAWGSESFIGTPLMGSEGEIVGLVSASDRRPKEFTEIDIQILQIISQRAAAEILRWRQEEARRKLQEQLFHAQKLESVGKLAGGIAHDFNNLLTGIMGFTEMALQKAEPTGKLLEYLKQVLSLSQRACDLVKQLLLFSRPTAGRRAACDLHQFLSDVAALLRRTIPENIEIKLGLESEPIFVTADPSQLQQVILNLALNARDAMPHGGRLRIETRRIAVDELAAAAHPNGGIRPGSYVRATVSDTGEGIPPHVLPHIFDPFFTTKEAGKGTGLGLSVVYGIVKEHGGWIEVESNVGRGTSFHIFLPTTERPAEPAPPEVEENLVGGNETLLLVEDEPMVLDLGRRLLEMLGYRVLTARHGREAVDVYAEHRNEIALVLLDVVLPEMSGEETFRELRKLNPDVKVLLSTGYSPEGVAERLLRQGAVSIVQKPYDLRVLARAVRQSFDAAKKTECAGSLPCPTQR